MPLHLKVSGMHCASCATTVQRAIESRPGVRSASVSVTTGLAMVEGEGLDTETITAAIRDRGYDADPIDGPSAPAELRSELELRQARQERLWRFRALLGLGLWVPMALVHWLIEGAWVPWLLLAGATAVVAIAGAGFYRSALAAARRGTTNMDTLISMGATTAYVFSVVVFVAKLLDPENTQPLYFTEAAALLGLISLGHWLEARASAKAGSAVRELLSLQPDEAELIDTGNETRMIESARVQPGDRMLIRPGARVPVDGVVVEGTSDVDQSVVTGESVPVRKSTGDEVVAGSMNTTGRLVVEASVDGLHTTVARIAEIVQLAQGSKAEIQRLADRVSAIFVPTVLGIAAVTLAGWWLAGDFRTGVIATVTVLIISCPCALGLATPMAVMVGTGAASRHGILIKTAGALERAGRARRVVFDKTGTLTSGRFAISEIRPESAALDETGLLRLAAAAEAPSEHPIARAITSAARERGLTLPRVEAFEAIPGEGVRGVVEGQRVEVRRDAETSCYVSIDGKRVGSITVSDTARPDAREAVDRLRALGLEVTMLSGDRTVVAERIGGELGFAPDEIIAEATPESKADIVAKMPAGTVMIGDGINDAAALASADVGIALASGTTIAIESADVVIPSEHVLAVPETIELARSTLRTIKQNLFFAFLYNVAAIPAAALGLLGTMGPLIAAGAMGASDITVIGNALWLKRRLDRQLTHSR